MHEEGDSSERLNGFLVFISLSAYTLPLAMAAHQPNQYLIPQQQPKANPSQQSLENSAVQPLSLPQHATTPVMSAPPMAAPMTTATIYVPQSGENHSRIAWTVYLLARLTLICATLCVLPLICFVPALVLSWKALTSRGPKQKRIACISVGMSVAAILCGIIMLAIAVGLPLSIMTTTTPYPSRNYTPTTTSSYYTYCSCPSYYSCTYGAYCTPYSYSTTSSCRYSTSSGSYCPGKYYTPTTTSAPTTTSSYYTYRSCPSYYSYRYSTYCKPYSYSTTGSCRYYAPGRYYRYSCYYGYGRYCPT